MKTMYQFFLLLAAMLIISSFSMLKPTPVLYIVGDSTVKNGSGKGTDGLWGWGSFLHEYFKTGKIQVDNRAIGGRSTRTFITDGRWNDILKTLKKGDYVIIQFGHNDNSPLDDTARALGTIGGIGNEAKEIYNPIRKTKETVYSYGHYLRQFVNETQSKGATAIICSPIPRNLFNEGKTVRAAGDYGLWAKQVAEEAGACFIDLNASIADEYDRLVSAAVSRFFPKDHTHPNMEGSRLNADKVVQGIKALKKCRLRKFLR